MGDKEYKLSDVDTHKNEVIQESKNVEYNDVKGMIFRIELK